VSVPSELAAGVIHDIGYRHYEGARLGRLQGMLALYVHSLRGMYGLGRPARAKVVPFLLFVITCAPGVVSGALTAVAPLPAIPYAHYATFLQLPIIVFVAAQAPQVVTADLRFRTLSLYFSRPLERSDYVVAKLAAIASGVFVLIATPILVIYAVILLSHTHSLSDAVNETGRVLVALAGVAVAALLLSAIGMAISALTRVRAFAIVAVVGLYLVTSAVAAIMLGVTGGSEVGRAFGLVSPFTLLDGFQTWALGVSPAAPPGPGDLGWAYGLVTAAVFAAAVGLLQLRYRRIAP
jgi:ABC-2 type transport system permease protein